MSPRRGNGFIWGVLVFHCTEIEGLVEIARIPREDTRGRFARIFDSRELLAAGWRWPVVHVNVSETVRAGTVRGLHYQVPPRAEAKLVTCVRGEIRDVSVDVRSGSPTFLKWCARTLSGDGLNSMLVPPGFAHGFQAMSAHATVVYVHSCEYSPPHERGIGAEDERLGVSWPLPVSHLSARDASYPPLDAGFTGVTL
ncbi:dTDP-4-dehydrorhamnose 3,5-epimerase family protein [Streptomyces sp. NPDC007905]|uniref:dTDP-4-dehydrorhamnose 3,5-epimerase family protein n=1 Tax=Streptomyces sp. NPDC007905 TaxID=3364788 RepID=UPI0036ECCC92